MERPINEGGHSTIKPDFPQIPWRLAWIKMKGASYQHTGLEVNPYSCRPRIIAYDFDQHAEGCKMKTPDDTIAIAHRVLAHEDFDETARILLKLLSDAQSKFPGANRYLYLEIDGHRNAMGGFDQDMLELQTKFMEDFLIQFLIGADTPLAKFKNPKPQINEIPNELNLIKIDPPASGGPGESGIKPRF